MEDGEPLRILVCQGEDAKYFYLTLQGCVSCVQFKPQYNTLLAKFRKYREQARCMGCSYTAFSHRPDLHHITGPRRDSPAQPVLFIS
jgi:hypothetical protein